MNRPPITPELAELCGIISGDGHLSRYVSKRRADYRIEVVGNITEDKEYFTYVKSLFRDVFGREFTLRHEQGYARLYLNSKEIVLFLEEIGLIVGKKSDKIRIPELFLKDINLTCHFIRGLADTDFSVNFKKGGRKTNSYPKIVAEFASLPLMEDLLRVFEKLGFRYYHQDVRKKTNFGEFTHYRIELNGRKNLQKWMEHIGFRNSKHLTKLLLWKKCGFCPPHTSLSERLERIKGVGTVEPTP